MDIHEDSCVSKSLEQCTVDTKIIVDDLALISRFYSQQDKVTQQSDQWLGIILDVLTGRYFVPKEKIVKLMHSIGSVLATQLVPACLRILASVTGQIISVSLAMGPVARLRTKALAI